MTKRPDYHNGSFWVDTLDELRPPQPPDQLPKHLDVAIVGAGYTGLWTAYYLNQEQPHLNIGVFEAQCVGFGASGRNGGWAMGSALGIRQVLENPNTRTQGVALQQEMHDTLDEIARVCQAENIDCHFARGGTLTVARYPHEVASMKASVALMHSLGFSENDYAWLEPEESAKRIGAVPNLGANYTSQCAAIHPARLVLGLAETLRGKGVSIFEKTPVERIESGRVDTPRGSVKASNVLRATEGYTNSISGQPRTLLPLYTMMIATQPLDDALWQEVGLHKRETFDDGRHLTIFGQKTLDGRLAFGRGLEYYFGAKLLPVLPAQHPYFKRVEEDLKAMFPMLDAVQVTHKWGGLFGVPRNGRPFVQFDAKTGLGAAGGYMGEGVGASNLAARILTDRVLDRDTPLTRLPWAHEKPATWPREPLPWLGSLAVKALGGAADRIEAKTNRPSRVFAGLLDRMFDGA